MRHSAAAENNAEGGNAEGEATGNRERAVQIRSLDLAVLRNGMLLVSRIFGAVAIESEEEVLEVLGIEPTRFFPVFFSLVLRFVEG